MRGVARLFLAFLTFAVVSGCEAVAPVAPAPTQVRLVVLFDRPTRPAMNVVLSPYAFLMDSDGTYTDVTSTAQWTPSNSSVVRSIGFIGGNSFIISGSGTISILGSYQGLAGFVTLTVPPGPTNVGPVLLGITSGDLGIGHTLTLTARDPQSRDVTSAASWTSADPSIATVSQGVVTAVAIGTTTISVAFGGGVDTIMVSVLPSRGPR
jgi:hypothetical protein